MSPDAILSYVIIFLFLNVIYLLNFIRSLYIIIHHLFIFIYLTAFSIMVNTVYWLQVLLFLYIFTTQCHTFCEAL